MHARTHCRYVMTDGSSFKRKHNGVSESDDLIVGRFRELGALIMPPTTMTEGGVSPVGYNVDMQVSEVSE